MDTTLIPGRSSLKSKHRKSFQQVRYRSRLSVHAFCLTHRSGKLRHRIHDALPALSLHLLGQVEPGSSSGRRLSRPRHVELSGFYACDLADLQLSVDGEPCQLTFIRSRLIARVSGIVEQAQAEVRGRRGWIVGVDASNVGR